MKIQFIARLCLLMVVLLSNVIVSAADLPDLLLRHREALGGKDVIQSIRSLHTVWRMQMMGLDGSVEVWSVAPDKVKLYIKLPVIEQTQGDDGTVAWTMDQNNQVSLKTSKYDTEESLSPVLPEFQYLFPNDSIRVSDKGEAEIDGVRYRILEVSEPWNETPRTLYLDPETYLIRIEKGYEEGIPVTMRYETYKKYDGIMVPVKYTQQADIQNMPASIFELKSLVFNEPMDENIFHPPAESQKDYEFETKDGRTEVPLKKVGEHVFLDVFINGEGPYLFLLDSGAGASMLDLKLARDLRMEIKEGMHALGVGGLKDMGAVTVESLKIEGLTIHDMRMYASDMSFLSEAFNQKIQGILGYDLFVRTVLTLNIPFEKLTIQSPDAFEYSGNGTIVEGEIDNNLMYIKGRLDGEWEGLFRVDTGASGALHIHGPFAEKHKLYDRYSPKYEIRTQGAGGEESGFLTRARSLEIGGFKMENVLVSLPGQESRGAMSVVDSIGTIGNTIWSRFTIIFDYARNRLILEPNSSLKTPMILNRTGFFAQLENGKWIVSTVFENTPADRAGMKSGDVLLKVNKIPAEKLTRNTLTAMSKAPVGTTMRIKLMRNGKTIRIKFRLADYL